MSGAAGWVIATGAVTMLNDLATRPPGVTEIDYIKIPIATAVGVGLVSLLAKVSPQLATALAVGSFITVSIAPLNGKQAPVTTIIDILKRVKVTS